MRYNIWYLVLFGITMCIALGFTYSYGTLVGIGIAVASTIGLAAGIISERNEQC